MSVELATGYVNIVPSARGIGDAIFKELVGPVGDAAGKAGEDAGKKISAGLLGQLGDTGKKLVVALGLAAVGAAAFSAATDVEDANNIIARSTGATGKALEGLQESFRNIASSSGASFETIATTLSELSQNTGLTGKALETLTAQVITFNRITKDSPITVDALTHALAGFNIPADRMGKVLDELFIISQKTGVPLADLLATLQTAGPIARQFGFSIEFTATLLAQLNKAGLDANQILPGLRAAFVNFAKAGREPAAALRETLDAIDALIKKGDLAGARQLAVQIFGARGAGLVDAAIQGKISLDDLGTSISLLGPGILETAGKTGTLSGALGVLKNNVRLALAEFATPVIQAANEALRAVLPAIRDVGAEFAKLPDGVKLTVGGLIGLVALAGPLGQFGQGIEGLGTVVKGIGTGFQLGAVRALELAEAIKGLGLAGGLMAGGITLGLAAIAAGFLVIFNASERLAPGLERAEDLGKRFARTFIVGAKSSADELKTLEEGLTNVEAAQQRIMDGKFGDTLRSNSQEAINYSDGAKAAQVQLRELGATHDAVAHRIANLKQQLAEQKAQQQATQESLAGYNAAVAAGSSATGAFAQATEGAQQAILNFQAALLGAAGGEIAHQQQLINIAKAQADYSAAVGIFGEESAEANEKLLALNQAELQGAQSADELDKAKRTLITSILDGTIAYDGEIARLNDLIGRHPENAAGYQLEIDKLNDAKTAADGLAGFVASVTVTADTSQADNAIGNFFARWRSQGGINIGFGIHIQETAVGGIFDRPQIRLISEAGPEAVLPLNDPTRSFQILAETGLLSNSQSAAIPEASGATGGLRIDNAVFGDRDVIPDLDYWARTRMAAS